LKRGGNCDEERRTIGSKLDAVVVGREDGNSAFAARSWKRRELSMREKERRGERERKRTDLVDLRSLLAMLVDDNHFGVDQRLVLDEEGRAESDDLDVVDKLDVAEKAVRNLLDFGAKSVDMLSLSIDVDVLEAFPADTLESNGEGVVVTSSNVLASGPPVVEAPRDVLAVA
jgi:hypothetical protein